MISVIDCMAISIQTLREKHGVKDAVFSPVQRRGSKLHFTIMGADSDSKNTETGTPQIHIQRDKTTYLTV